MSNLLEGLKKYFETNSRDVVKEAWAQTKEFENIGPAFEDFYNFTKGLMFKRKLPNDLIINSNQNINPKFSSDFFLTTKFKTYATSCIFYR